jgi:hypothetical protein
MNIERASERVVNRLQPVPSPLPLAQYIERRVHGYVNGRSMCAACMANAAPPGKRFY